MIDADLSVRVGPRTAVLSARAALERKKGRLTQAALLAPAAGPIFRPSQQPRARLPNRLVDKPYCRRSSHNAASAILASQIPISPSSVPAFPHSPQQLSSQTQRKSAEVGQLPTINTRGPATYARRPGVATSDCVCETVIKTAGDLTGWTQANAISGRSQTSQHQASVTTRRRLHRHGDSGSGAACDRRRPAPDSAEMSSAVAAVLRLRRPPTEAV
jgi:hypothetical protein